MTPDRPANNLGRQAEACRTFRELEQPRTIRTLIGHQHVDVGLKCLGSLIHFMAEPISLVIHDDGTLESEDRIRLTSSLPNTRIVNREEADAFVLPKLKSYPSCKLYRERHPLALKLLDIPLMAGEELAYCDTDILFLRPFKNLFSWPIGKTAGVFMHDSQDAYALYPWHTSPFGEVALPQRINTGLIFFRRDIFDLDFVEWFLGQPQFKQVFGKRPHFIEQTCWAAMGWRAGCHVWNSKQLIIADRNMTGVTHETVAIHFVAAYRGNLQKFSPTMVDQSAEPATIGVSNTRKTSPLHLLAYDLLRRL